MAESKPNPTAASETVVQSPRVSFLVPTLRRVDFLTKCINAIVRQTVPAWEVLVGIRADDAESQTYVASLPLEFRVSVVEARGCGVVGSMNSCLAAASGDFLVLVDDDVELPPDWLATMLEHLQSDAALLGAGGRDYLQDHPEMRRTEPRTLDVGRFHWYGRITGNHHKGGGMARRVDILRGSNCLFRADFLKRVGFETGLRGKGAQVHWELALALQARKQGGSLFYDPDVEILHHVAPRHDADSIHRGKFNSEATEDLAFNETFVVLAHGSGLFRPAALLWQLAIGSATTPGFYHFLKQCLAKDPCTMQRVSSTMKGRFAAARSVSAGVL
jgi:GT2 family glycosyltransferase